MGFDHGYGGSPWGERLRSRAGGSSWILDRASRLQSRGRSAAAEVWDLEHGERRLADRFRSGHDRRPSLFAKCSRIPRQGAFGSRSLDRSGQRRIPFPNEAGASPALAREIYKLHQAREKLNGQTNDIFVTKTESIAQKTLAFLLLASGVPLHQPGPSGELFVEVHKKDGITVGMAGAASLPLTPSQCFVRYANERKDRLSPSEIEKLAEIEREEREAIERGAYRLLQNFARIINGPTQG